MTISVTPNPTATPPSCTVTVSVATGNVMSAVAVYRNDHNGRTLLRTQPTAGFDSRTIADIECPYEENVTYDWVADYIDTSNFTTVFDETWVSAAAWTADIGSGNVSGGKLRNSTSPMVLRRTFAAARHRVTIGSLELSPAGGATLLYIKSDTIGGGPGIGSGDYVAISTGSFAVRIDHRLNGFVTTSYTSGIDLSAPVTVDFLTSSVRVSGTGGSVTFAGSFDTQSILLYSGGAAINASKWGEIEVETYGSSAAIAEASDPVALSPESAWLIHPGSPGLSFPLARSSSDEAGIRSIEPVVNRSNTTVHKVLGSATPIPTTTGPRSDDETVMAVATVTSEESAALRALLADDVPLLIQIPPSWDLDFNSGFYQPGDVSTSRLVDMPVAYRVVTMPLQKVQSPVVDIENTGWSYASVAVEFATYAGLLTSFGTYADLASNTRL